MTRHEYTYEDDARREERGAALITATLISLLMLAAGCAFIMVAARSIKNAYGSTPETQAYYAAEAGAQAALNALRGQVQPVPLFNTALATAAENKITFRQMESIPTLSRWLTYNTAFSPARVTLTSNYTQANGMAYNVSVIDPDNTRTVIFGVAGSFPTNSNSTSYKFGSTNFNEVTLAYTPPTTNPATVNLTGSQPFGTLTFTPKQSNQFSGFTIADPGVDFNLTITQSAPYPATAAAPVTLVLKCKIKGVISPTAASNTVQLVFPTLSNNISGVSYVRTTSTGTVAQPLAYATATAVAPSTVTAPNPYRLILNVTGFGPSFAEKRLHLMVNRLAFDFTAPAAVTLRGADSGGTMGFAVGDSAKYTYTGNDNAGGVGLPAFAVTNGTDLSTATTNINGGTQVTGSSQVQQLSPSSLNTFLQTAQGARDLVNALREYSQGEYWPLGSTGVANDRYFPSGTAPSDYGANNLSVTPNGLFTFVDGDAALPPAGGAGMLVVTGTLDMRGSAEFKGLILVLGKGEVIRNGGGNGTTLGSIVVAKFGATGDFLAPTFDSNGSGTSDVKYDSKWVETALTRLGPRVVAVSEY
jgi:hypothetical protein